MSKKQKDEVRVDDGMNFVFDKINDAEFIKGFGHYIKFDDQFVVPKYQDIVYARTKTLDVSELVERQQKYLEDKKVFISGESVYFLVPISAVIALPANYHSNRILLKKDLSMNKILSVTLVTGVQNYGKDDDDDDLFSGVCFGLLGYRNAGTIKEDEIGRMYEECVEYLNDFITAYKLFRHDHTVHNVTIRTLPGRVEYYTETSGKLSEKKLARFHDNDIADLWSKRLPFKNEMDEIRTLSEFLPSNKIAHYALRIAEQSITDICLGQYEDSVLNADRFAELALRDILQQELELTTEEMGNYKNLWSKKHPDTAVIQVLAERFDIKGNATLDKWYRKSRTARNSIVHKLDISSITPEIAFDAVKYNMLIVRLMVSKSTLDFEWYKLPPDTFSKLFLSGKSLNS